MKVGLPYPGYLLLSADYLSFARSKGAFIGISLEGAVIAARDEYDQTYYGKPVRPVEILLKGEASPGASRRSKAVREGAERESAESTGPSVTSIAVAGRLLWEDHRGSKPHSDRGVFRGGGKNEAGYQGTLP